MNHSMVEDPVTSSALVALGRIAKAQGRHGEVSVQLFSDATDRFDSLDHVTVGTTTPEPREYRIESVRWHKGRAVVKLEGVATISDAEALSGSVIGVPRAEVADAPGGSFYHFDIVGLPVYDRRRGLVGTAANVLATGGTDVLVVETSVGAELLLPLCTEICHLIDPVAGRIEIDAPEGLLDLNAN